MRRSGDPHGLECGHVADGAGIEPVGHAELHAAEEQERDPTAGRQGGGRHDPRQTDHEGDEVTEDDRFDGAAVLLFAQGDGHRREREAGERNEPRLHEV